MHDSKVDSKNLKSGFTTGSCATAASKAALTMLITKNEINSVKIVTPAGVEYSPVIYGAEICENHACCYVIKESGDDPDITAGIKVYAEVSYSDSGDIEITGGKGVGKVTRPGLDQPVGEYAINSTPRKMIKAALQGVLDDYDIERGVKVTISIPEGVEIAEKTFNPHMGIEGGISVIGTSGIVEPMSTKALIDTIRLDINMQYKEGMNKCIIVPGNYGVTFLKNNYEISDKQIVLCSNYVGDSIKMAVEVGFKEILFCSHIGKLIKVSGGIMNTHSSYGDRRMELMKEAYVEACSVLDMMEDKLLSEEILNCVSTTAALFLLEKKYADDANEAQNIDSVKNGGTSEHKTNYMIDEVSKIIVTKSKRYLEEACNFEASLQVILYENNYGLLASI